jgi:hypothetical protein
MSFLQANINTERISITLLRKVSFRKCETIFAKTFLFKLHLVVDVLVRKKCGRKYMRNYTKSCLDTN